MTSRLDAPRPQGEGEHLWHAIDALSVAEKMGTDPLRGLDSRQLQERRARHGPNELAEQSPQSPFATFLRQFRSPLIYLLIAAALLAFWLGERVDAAVIAVVLVFNAALGALHEGRAERAMTALRRLVRQRARVLRDATELEVDARELVPGDVVVLTEGDAITADARVIEAASLAVSESTLTGESTPVFKAHAACPPDTPLSDRTSMLHAGTQVVAGRGRAIVVRTGMETEFGRIAQLTGGAAQVRTPLEQRLDRFGRTLLLVAWAIFASVLLLGWLRDVPASELWMVAISQLVSVVPEGLPVALTVALAAGTRRMAERRAIVRRLVAVETLGCTSAICADKTGTLTRNEMTVTSVLLPSGRPLAVEGTGYSPDGVITHAGGELEPLDEAELRRLAAACVLCNDARVVKSGSRWMPLGDPTEAALVVFASKAGCDFEVTRAAYPRCGELPFDSAARRMATEHVGLNGVFTVVKGAPEAVLGLVSGSTAHWVVRADQLASRGLRVLAVARVERGLGPPSDRLGAGFEMLGLVGELDPPREGAREAIEACGRAGIRAIMVTGDHRLTAQGVADSIGLESAGGRLVEGRELDLMDDAALDQRCATARVFARMQPDQKLRLVQALQHRGEVVAMTGDGVNDAPALVRADVGVAMGASGTEVARQAADIVLSDDDFSSIVSAVEEGRIVQRNVQKIVLLLLSTSLAESIVLIACLAAGLPLPFAAVQILWNNVITEGTVTVNLALDPRDGDEMRTRPRPRAEPLLTRDMLTRLVLMSLSIAGLTLGWFVLGVLAGRELREVRTEAFTLLAVCEWFNLLNCRSSTKSVFELGVRGNRWLIAGLCASVVLQATVVYAPGLNDVFHTAPLAFTQVAKVIAVGSVVLWVEELRKLLARRRRPS